MGGKKYKEMSEELSFFESNQRKLKFRGNFSEDLKEDPGELDVLLKNVTIFDLAKAFRFALDRVSQKPTVHEIKKINVTIDEQMQLILSILEKEFEIHFLKLVDEMNEKIRIVVTFVAMLELVKMGRVGIKETPEFNDFILMRINNG